MPTSATGFTLIELLIALAIISILTAVALPQYQSHTSRSALLACYQEILHAQPGFEFVLATEGKIDESWLQTSKQALKPLHVPQARACQQHTLTSNGIQANPAGNPAVSGLLISLNRQPDSGIWHCIVSNVTDDDKSLLPKGCFRPEDATL
ncbi:prepilin-type N-terminal cleavage/methylation domain-containing protein [Chromatiaceae bacterium AAb-1]|nr:prepilin-type N-terminal cleavage/methylation domain-containing protein [Chromatiaceae bacterium AAb-1]